MKIPEAFKFGSLTFPIYETEDGRLAFNYKDGNTWKKKKRRALDKLRADAEKIAASILNAESAIAQMTAEDRRIYVAASATLASIGIDVDSAARLLVEAAQFVGGIDRVVEACRYFSQSQRHVKDGTTADVVTHFIRHLRSDKLDPLYVEPMESDLGKFAERFPQPISTIRAGDMDDWLRDMPIGLRRRRNFRAELVTLFNFAVSQGYLPENLKTEAAKIKRPKVPRKAPAIYTPEELDLLIQQCHQAADKKSGRKDYRDFLPVLVIAAFAGLRWEEIFNLEWKDIHWEDEVIEVGEENKTGFRKVPIQPNLKDWLEVYRGRRSGPVCPYNRKQTGNLVRRMGMRAGLPVGGRRYANALRHSCVTYRVAVTQNMPLVSNESGHSVQELRRSYNRASLQSVGNKWFSITRGAPDNVTQMPLPMFSSK